MLDFKPFLLESKPTLDSYFSQYGEGSCQHSFAASFCMNHKYGDLYSIQNGFLFILREKRCTEKTNTYLFPLGNMSDTSSACTAIDAVLRHAHDNGKKVIFETITEKSKNFIEEHYPEHFNIEEKRENAEYIFNRKNLSELKGKEYEEKRWEIHRFQKEYEGRYSIEPLSARYFDEIKTFAKRWYEDFYTLETNFQLSAEENALNRALENFDALGLHGLVILIDGKIAAFEYGIQLNENTYDGCVEKADRSYKYIYKILNHTVAKNCADSIKYLNWEEDLGHEGLRKMKLSYKPEFLLKKYLVKEKD